METAQDGRFIKVRRRLPVILRKIIRPPRLNCPLQIKIAPVAKSIRSGVCERIPDNELQTALTLSNRREQVDDSR